MTQWVGRGMANAPPLLAPRGTPDALARRARRLDGRGLRRGIARGDDHRRMGQLEDLFGRRSKDLLRKPLASVRSDDDKLSAHLVRKSHDLVRDVSRAYVETHLSPGES